jgi:hypothetical protein
MIKGTITPDFIGLKIADGLKGAKQDLFVSDFFGTMKACMGR